jgi:mannitol-1-phosphate 5-dehydrogenase
MSGKDRDHVMTGFGFGPIQAGLFFHEAFVSGRFSRLVAAEVDAGMVRAVNDNGNRYALNIARASGVEQVVVGGVELINPRSSGGRAALVDAIAASTEIVTALPSVEIFSTGGKDSVAAIIADGLTKRAGAPCLVYAAENNTRAAEVLESAVRRYAPELAGVQFLNTVIGKMSRVVTDPAEIREHGLAPMVPGAGRAFLLEAFNHIFVSRTRLQGVKPGIDVFEEKDDLRPFEEAKLYGHNAVHALLGYLALKRGYTMMSDMACDESLMKTGRTAFLEESGRALMARHAGKDPMFTPEGFRAYAEDLLERMVNPYLRDDVARVTRDPRRKLAWGDRLLGTMQLALPRERGRRWNWWKTRSRTRAPSVSCRRSGLTTTRSRAWSARSRS